MLDHLVVLLEDQVPPNRATENACEVGERSHHARVGKVEAFVFDALEARHQADAAQQVTKCKGDFELTVGVPKFFSTRISVS